MTLTSVLRLILQCTGSKSLDLELAPQAALKIQPTVTLANGTGANQADKFFSDKRTLGNGASEELDLAGALVDAFGDTVTLARVKVLYIYNPSADATLVIGGAAATQFAAFLGDVSDKIVLRPGGRLLLIAPDATAYVSTGGAADKLKIAHGGEGASGVDYEILVIGATA